MPAMTDNTAPATLEALVNALRPEVADVLNRALAGEDIAVEDADLLFATDGPEFLATTMVADELRRRSVGDLVTYVVNRNVNFTNVCIKRCGFCAFSRDFREEEGYFLPVSEIIRRAKEAQEYGATEVCIQAGLPPQMEGDLYIRLCEAIKEELPDMHVHGFSPEEVLYGSIRSRCSIREYLQGLKDAGVGSLPGTSAEVLDQELRDIISPGRITVDQWIEVITTAHDLGIPTTSTVMFGHRETNAQIVRHIALAARHSAKHWRIHRIRATELCGLGSADVLQANGGRRAFWTLRYGCGEGARHRANYAEQLDSQHSGVLGQGRQPDVPTAAHVWRQRPGWNAD